MDTGHFHTYSSCAHCMLGQTQPAECTTLTVQILCPLQSQGCRYLYACCINTCCHVCRISNRVSGTQLPAAMQRYRHLQRPSHRRANSAELPPLSILPPPVFPNSAPSPDIDMNVDYEAEIAPALQQCLVRLLQVCLRVYLFLVFLKQP